MNLPVCEPALLGNEKAYVLDALESGWISSSGKYVSEFENAFARYCGVRYGVAVCNGTTAIHLALVAAGIGRGDEVIVPAFTMIATAFAVCYTGAVPVFVDADPATWNIDPVGIESRISSRTKAIIPVHIYGYPCNMDAICDVATRHGLIVIEDGAEGHGAEYRGRKIGSFGQLSAFSFFANKNITTGEGGMVVTDDGALAERCRYYKNVCFPPDAPRTYVHEDIGFNYRMSNIHAAIGLAQVEKADFYRGRRIENGLLYRQLLSAVPGISFQVEDENCLNVYWMNSILLDPRVYGRTRDELAVHLRQAGIETRNFFVGLHRQPSLRKYGCRVSDGYPNTDKLSDDGLYLPSSSLLNVDQIDYVCRSITSFRR